jgi:hypothetical protein
MARTVFYISDGTGITAETLGHSLMTQFDQVHFKAHTLPYIDREEKALGVVDRINCAYQLDGVKPIVFSTIVKPEIQSIITSSNCLVIDFFKSFIGTLEQELKTLAQPAVGLSHAVTDMEEYNLRMEAVNFTLQCDDGVSVKAYHSADLILMGPSRTGKTPTCLYLALQFGIRAANFPLTEDELIVPVLPTVLEPFRDRLFGLTIAADRLHQIRTKRRPNSPYASLPQCEKEINAATLLYRNENIPTLNSTFLSIEELSTHILSTFGLRR